MSSSSHAGSTCIDQAGCDPNHTVLDNQQETNGDTFFDDTLGDFAHLVFVTRSGDGFVNVNRMCASVVVNKEVTWWRYKQTQHGKTYIRPVLHDLNLQGMDSVVHSQRDSMDGDCTWVHPRIAIGVAAWGDPSAGKAILRIAVRLHD
jgi:hypothetical protein